MTDAQLLEQLGAFDPSWADGVRAVRRPAGADLLVEMAPRAGHASGCLASFWLGALWRFLEDSRQNTEAFEGLAYQALAEALGPSDFQRRYEALRARLSLPPREPVELSVAYRVLQGRIQSFAGWDRDGDPWCAFFEAEVFALDSQSLEGGW